MHKKAALLLCHGDSTAGEQFLLAYQRCILLALEKEGYLSREETEECIRRLRRTTI